MSDGTVGIVIYADNIPIACNLPEHEQAARGEDIADDLLGGCTSVHELADGYAFSFPSEDVWAARLLEFVLEERKCCPFFRFAIVFEPGGGLLQLHLSGAEGVKQFIQENFLGYESSMLKVQSSK